MVAAKRQVARRVLVDMEAQPQVFAARLHREHFPQFFEEDE